MCGIAVTINDSTNGNTCKNMLSAMKNRGTSVYNLAASKIDICFTWLPITDGQLFVPHFSIGGYTVFLNGFISNYKELAEKHKIYHITNCDTEIVAALFDRFGYEIAKEFNGFFAIVAIKDGNVTCITDRYGIKQLYKYEKDGITYIASEVKAILTACPDIETDRIAVEDWHYSLGVMTENTIYKGIERINWFDTAWQTPKKHTIQEVDYPQALEKVKELLQQAFARNKYDGPTGVFLSGGVDSGAIARYMDPEYSFSMDYVDSNYSEIGNIKLNSVGHHLTMVCNDALADKYDRLTFNALDDLKAGSCYTNFALAELASKFCRVVYSGAGGDELFNGYTHRYNRSINEVINRCGTAGHKLYDITHKQYDWLFLRALLVVEDRMTAYHTMECRYPLLDNDLVNYVLTLPDEYLENKQILKDAVDLDLNVLHGRKMGFCNPHFGNREWAAYAYNMVTGNKK